MQSVQEKDQQIHGTRRKPKLIVQPKYFSQSLWGKIMPWKTKNDHRKMRNDHLEKLIRDSFYITQWWGKSGLTLTEFIETHRPTLTDICLRKLNLPARF